MSCRVEFDPFFMRLNRNYDYIQFRPDRHRHRHRQIVVTSTLIKYRYIKIIFYSSNASTVSPSMVKTQNWFSQQKPLLFPSTSVPPVTIRQNWISLLFFFPRISLISWARVFVLDCSQILKLARNGNFQIIRFWNIFILQIVHYKIDKSIILDDRKMVRNEHFFSGSSGNVSSFVCRKWK